MAMYPLAKRMILKNTRGIDTVGMQTPVRLVVHIAQGGSLDGIQGEFENTTEIKATHFAVGTQGDVWQFVDTSNVAFGVGGRVPNLTSIHAENVGFSGNPLVFMQLDALAQLLAWLNTLYHVPFKLAQDKTDSGLAYHAQFGGHPFCPGKPIIDQLQDILDVAQSAYST